jgi:hypothetical protein
MKTVAVNMRDIFLNKFIKISNVNRNEIVSEKTKMVLNNIHEDDEQTKMSRDI